MRMKPTVLLASSTSSAAALLRTTAVSIAILFIGLPGLYTSYSELRRRALLRRRKSAFALRHDRDPSPSSAPLKDVASSSLESTSTSSNDIVSPEERIALETLFGSTSIAGRYTNPFPEWREHVGMLDWLVWKFIWQPWTGKWGWKGGASKTEMANRLVVQTPDWTTISSEEIKRKNEHESKLTHTWIGQSTSYVQLERVHILTDPIFEDQTIDSIFAPYRLTRVPCQVHDLPNVHVVLVSHNHFDHLHPRAVESLLKYFPDAVYCVPLGVGNILKSWGVKVKNVHEMDWWETRKVRVPGRDQSIEVICTPAMHWSARSPLDTNQTLWCSFMVKGSHHSFFHCGDTGYVSKLFSAIARLHGSPTLAAIPLGAYLPRWHLRSVHLSPEDAVQVHLDLGAKWSVGVHHSTWILSDEGFEEPVLELERIKKLRGVGQQGEIEAAILGRTKTFHLIC